MAQARAEIMQDTFHLNRKRNAIYPTVIKNTLGSISPPPCRTRSPAVIHKEQAVPGRHDPVAEDGRRRKLSAPAGKPAATSGAVTPFPLFPGGGRGKSCHKGKIRLLFSKRDVY